jgi:hypothetical protein
MDESKIAVNLSDKDYFNQMNQEIGRVGVKVLKSHLEDNEEDKKLLINDFKSHNWETENIKKLTIELLQLIGVDVD